MIRITNRLEIFNSTFRRNIDNTLNELGQFAKSKLDEHAAVDTGFMKSNNKYFVKTNKVEVGNYNVEYNIYQEFGTSKMPSHPFVRPAAFNYQSQLKNIAITNLRRGMT